MRRTLESLGNQVVRHGLAVIFVVGLLLVCPFLISMASSVLESQRSTSRRPSQRPRAPQRPKINYSQFSHTTHVEKQKLACDSCHKFPTRNWKELRKGDAAFPDVGDFPEHASCLNCHRQQFFARERPAPVICSNCHIAVTPRDTARWLFPSLGDLTDPKLKRRNAPSEFGVGFPHEKHLEVVGFNGPRRNPTFVFTTVAFRPISQDEPKSCVVCHQTYQPQGESNDEYVTKPPNSLGDAFWVKKGTFKTTPVSHTTCFTCHNADSGIPPDSKDCNVCHKLLPPATKPRADFDPKLPTSMGITDGVILKQWSTRMSSGTFRHEGGAHPAVTCLNCHNVAAMNTLDFATRKVPVKSCGGADGCHVTATLDEGGALNFEIDSKKKDPKFTCTKCHVIFGQGVIPEDHSKAIVPATPAKKPGA
jgi:cytochrome c7-like protein